MITLHFEKLSRFERPQEICTAAVPFPKGELKRKDGVAVRDGGQFLPTQTRVTSSWPDGSIRWLLVRFITDLPGNRGKDLKLATGSTEPVVPEQPVEFDDENYVLTTGPLRVELTAPGEGGLFSSFTLDSVGFSKEEMTGPCLGAFGKNFEVRIDKKGWETVESGPVQAVIEARGGHYSGDERLFDCRFRLYAYAGKPWIGLDYQIINREESGIDLEGMGLEFIPQIDDPGQVRTALGISNYRTRIKSSEEGEEITHLIDAEQLVYEGNEQVPETLYGTFWADWSDGERGLCATIYQAQQNFPKALTVSGCGLGIDLYPEESEPLEIMQGVAKTHRIYLHFHRGEELSELNCRSLQFQLPDRPTLPTEVYRRAGVLPEDIWVEGRVERVERKMLDLADSRTRGYGMLNWGDGPDSGYTNQGRGRGEPVWTNNEYDLPHAALLLYAHTGERRMLDYLLVAARHWMDVDVCHYSDDPLRHQGQIVHSARHVTKGVTISHEWIEGLFDFYHQTGEDFAYQTALGIGENILRHLESPRYRDPGESAARDTGWALRSLVALYRETWDEKWLEPAEEIVDHFAAWREKYGAWLAPYTDHTRVRVPFMISIGVKSLMCYYRIHPTERVKELILDAVEDMIANCRLPDGRFYYKELPSLRRGTTSSQVVEALACAYDVSGERRFLEAGLTIFELIVERSGGGGGGPKYKAGDAVIWPRGAGPKAMANVLPGILTFYRAAVGEGLLDGPNGGLQS